MSISLLAVITAISGLLYSFMHVQREYVSPAYIDALLALTLTGATLLFVSVVNHFIMRGLEKSGKQAPSDLLRLAISAILLTLCGLLILKFIYDKDITALLATSAVISVALGWGLRGPVGHLFSGLTLEVERPMAVGDYIKINDQCGRIEALKWRAVHVRTIDNSLLILPNSGLTDNAIELFPSSRTCRHHIEVGIPNDIPPSRVLKAAAEVLSDQIPFVENSRDSSAQLTGLDSMSGTVTYRISYYTRNFLNTDDANTIILERLWYALARNGIDMSGLNLNFRFNRLLRGYQDHDGNHAGCIEQRIRFLQTIAAFQNLTLEAIRSLAEQLATILFTAGEAVKVQQQRPDSLFIVQTGRLSVQYRGANALLIPEPDAVTADAVASYPDASHWDRHILRQVSDNLTYCMGPVARQLVEREARFTQDPYELHQRLAVHIDDKAERERFLSNGPDAHVQLLVPGDGLCSIPIYEDKLGKPYIVALQESELLELTGDSARALRSADGTLRDALAAYIEQMQEQAVLRNRLAQVEGFADAVFPCHASD